MTDLLRVRKLVLLRNPNKFLIITDIYYINLLGARDMNVQFSLSAATSVGNQSKTEAMVKDTNKLSLLASNSPVIRDVQDLAMKERQGVNVSIADEQLIRTIERAVKSLQGPQTSLEISIHEKTHDIMVKVMNKETGELIREVPPEKTLDLVAKMMEIAGLLIDERV